MTLAVAILCVERVNLSAFLPASEAGSHLSVDRLSDEGGRCLVVLTAPVAAVCLSEGRRICDRVVQQVLYVLILSEISV